MTRRRPKPDTLAPVDDPQLQALCTQIANAKPGERLVYYTGRLIFDAEHSAHLQALRQIVWDAMESGHVYLTQRLVDRRGDAAVYDYVAVKRQR